MMRIGRNARALAVVLSLAVTASPAASAEDYFTFTTAGLALKLPPVAPNLAILTPDGTFGVTPAGLSYGGFGEAVFGRSLAGPVHVRGTAFGGLAFGQRRVAIDYAGPVVLTWAGVATPDIEIVLGSAAAFSNNGLGTIEGGASAGASTDDEGFTFAYAQAIPFIGEGASCVTATPDGCFSNIAVYSTSSPTGAFSVAAGANAGGGIVVVTGTIPTDAVALSQRERTRILGGSLGFAVGSGAIVPRIGLFAEHQSRMIETALLLDLPLDGDAMVASFALNETLNSLYLGPLFGFDLTADLGERASLRLSVEGAPVYLAAAYTGFESYASTTNGTTMAFSSDPTAISAARWSGFAAASGALDIRFGRSATLSIGGGARYYRAAPTVVRVPGDFSTDVGDDDVPPELFWFANSGFVTSGPSEPLVGLAFAPAYAFNVSIGITVGFGDR